MKTAALVVTAAAGGLISGTQLKPHTVPLSALTPAAVHALRGQRGPAGPSGTFDPSKIHVIQATATLAPNQNGPVDALCPAGDTVISGGGTAPGFIGDYPVAKNGQEGWEVYGYNSLPQSENEGATAVCVSP